ncbi:unnamed protein product [Arabidopsis halleri]
MIPYRYRYHHLCYPSRRTREIEMFFQLNSSKLEACWLDLESVHNILFINLGKKGKKAFG